MTGSRLVGNPCIIVQVELELITVDTETGR
jgi:hypothetical protein